MFKLCIISILLITPKIIFSQYYINWTGSSLKYDSTKYYRHNLKESSIINKAKLLTINRFGVYEIDSLINLVLNQKCVYYRTDSSFNYLTIVIDNNQPFLTNTSQEINNQTCRFVLVYSYRAERFFLIQGFDSSDINSFKKDIEMPPYAVFEFFYLSKEDFIRDISLIDGDTFDKILTNDTSDFEPDICCKCSDRYKYSADMLFSYDNIDNSSIIYKAKLLTLNKYGVISIDSTLKTVLKQNATTKHYKNKGSYLIIDIQNNQPFEVDYSPTEVFRLRFEAVKCRYKLVYCYDSNTFYKLEGFDSCDFLELYKLTKKLGDSFLSLISDANPISRLKGWLKLRCFKKQYIKEKPNQANECSCRCSQGYSNEAIEFY